MLWPWRVLGRGVQLRWRVGRHRLLASSVPRRLQLAAGGVLGGRWLRLRSRMDRCDVRHASLPAQLQRARRVHRSLHLRVRGGALWRSVQPLRLLGRQPLLRAWRVCGARPLPVRPRLGWARMRRCRLRRRLQLPRPFRPFNVPRQLHAWWSVRLLSRVDRPWMHDAALPEQLLRPR